MSQQRVSLADNVLKQMLDRIRSGQWTPGTTIPSQRKLVAEFGVSGVPLREALSMMKTLGILEISQGRKSVVRRLDTEVLQQLFPLAICLEGRQSFDQICELRLALEPRTAALAAERRSQEDLDALTKMKDQLRNYHVEGGEPFFDADLAFHVRVAEATGNPLFPLLLKAVSGFVTHAQTIGCSQSIERRLRAVWSHESILDAIAEHDPQRAYVEMEAHLRYNATHYFQDEAQVAAPIDAVNAAGSSLTTMNGAET